MTGPSGSPSTSLKDLIGTDKVTAEHVTIVLDTVSRVVAARVEAGLLEVAVGQRIRALTFELRSDTERARLAAEQFDRLQEHLDPEARSAVAAAIIYAQLGKG